MKNKYWQALAVLGLASYIVLWGVLCGVVNSIPEMNLLNLPLVVLGLPVILFLGFFILFAEIPGEEAEVLKASAALFVLGIGLLAAAVALFKASYLLYPQHIAVTYKMWGKVAVRLGWLLILGSLPIGVWWDHRHHSRKK